MYPPTQTTQGLSGAVGTMPPIPGVPPRRPRAGIPVVAGVVGLFALLAVGFAFGLFFGGGRLTLAARDGTRVQRASAQTIVQTLNSQAALYKLQHGDLPLDFVSYPKWDQLTMFTDERGATSQAKTYAMRFGPYLQYAPTNPLNNFGTVMVADAEPRHGDPIPGGQPVGFVFWPGGNRFFVTDSSGVRVMDPTARDAGGNR